MSTRISSGTKNPDKNQRRPLMPKSMHILIVGGGAAGWLSAAFLAKTLSTSDNRQIKISLIESPEIGIIGVGEGSFPSIRGTLAAIGISEARFIRECHATFKQGIQFRDWVHTPAAPTASASSTLSSKNYYFHPFSQPSQRTGMPELLPYWLHGLAGKDLAFADAVTMQTYLAESGRAPKRSTDKDFLGPMNYAYHFDAGRFANLLKEHARSLGVQHLLGNVDTVQLAESGAIASLHSQEHGQIQADLYIDCTGFRARLIGEALGSPFHRVNDVLFVDRALAVQVPYPQEQSPIPSFTISTALQAGWIWDIGLQQRRGIGYVYSSRHTDSNEAEQVLRRYVGSSMADLQPRQLQLELGYRPTQWVHNCVAIGLSGGFLEPLESSGIGLIETAAYLLSYLFPYNGEFAPVAKTFNHLMAQRYERIVEFIKLHYCLSQRSDSAFWCDNTAAASIPASLRDKLSMWRGRPPSRLDFITDLEMYPPSSWQYVLYGMEFKTQLPANLIRAEEIKAAQEEFRNIEKMRDFAANDLPDHRQLIAQICARP
jgi:tryptophan halogenase